MKKFLLSLAAICSFGFAANAETFEFNLNDAKNIDGTFNEETKKADGSVNQAARYQPLLSLELGDFTFSFERGSYDSTDKEGNPIVKDGTEPAYYYATSTNQNQQKTLRLYQGNIVTISAPAGTKIASVVAGSTTLYSGEGLETVTYTKTVSGTLKIDKITITTGAGVEPPVADENTILDVTFDQGGDKQGFTFEDGTLPEGLSFVWTLNTQYKYMKASGYYKKAYAVDGAYLVSPVIDLTGRKNIVLKFNQCTGQLKGADAADFLSLAVREEGGAWQTVALTSFPAAPTSGNFSKFEETAPISLDAFAGKKVQIGWCYTSTEATACTWEIDHVVVKGDKSGSAIETVEAADADAPVEFFNLQGVRVANPENGLFIRRQGNKVEKVVIR